MAGLITVFADNLPLAMDTVWLWQIFNPFGRVEDVYMPNKRSSSFNTKFGFIRFKRREEALAAIDALNGFLIRNFRMFVQLAKYSKVSPKVNRMRLNGHKYDNLASPVHNCQPKPVVGHVTSFAEVATDGKLNQPSRPGVKACDEGSDWLNRSAIGFLPSPRNVAFLREASIAEGISYIQARHMGGNLVLLTFNSLEDMSLMLEEAGKCWLRNWFVDVKKWSPDLKYVSKREVWLSCYGVPLNFWNSDTFRNIGNYWGDFITLDDATSNGSSFAVGKVKILTDVFETINQEICLELNGRSFPIRVLEEQLVVNNIMMANSVCRGSDKVILDSIARSEDESDGDSEKVEDDIAEEVNVENRVVPNPSNVVGKEVGLLDNAIDIAVDNVAALNGKDDELVSSPNSEGHSITSPVTLSRPVGMDRSAGISTQRVKSIHDAIQKLDRRAKRSRRKSSKKKPLSDFGLKVAEVKKKNNKGVSSSSLSSSDIRHRNSLLVMKARKYMEIGALLGVKYHGGEDLNIMKYIELEEGEILDEELGDFDDLEEGASLSVEF